MPVLPTASRAPRRQQQQEQDLWAGERSELKILLAESKTPSRGLQSDGLFFFLIRTIYNQYDVHRNRIAPGCVRNLTGSKKNRREISVIFKVG